MTICLHNSLITDHLIDQRGLLTSRLGLEPEHAVGFLCNKSRHKKGQRRNKNNDKCNPSIDPEHEAESSDDRHNTGKCLRKPHQQTIRKLIGICDHTADNITCCMTIQIF